MGARGRGMCFQELWEGTPPEQRYMLAEYLARLAAMAVTEVGILTNRTDMQVTAQLWEDMGGIDPEFTVR